MNETLIQFRKLFVNGNNRAIFALTYYLLLTERGYDMKSKSGTYKFLLWAIVCSFFFITLSGIAHSETITDSQIISDTTWTKSESPFLFTEKRAMPWLALLLFDDKGQISGIVSGTTVIAVADNEIVSSYGTSGKTPNVDRDGNGIAESFTFNLTNIPIGNDIYVYLITRGEIFSLYFASNGAGIPDINVFSLTFATLM